MKTKTELLEMRKKLSELQELRNKNDDLMGKLEHKISVQNYKICCSKKEEFDEKISNLKNSLYLEEIKACDHVIAKIYTISSVKYGVNEPVRDLPVYSCLRCDFTNLYNIMGSETLLQRDLTAIFNSTPLDPNKIIDLEGSEISIDDAKKLLHDSEEATRNKSSNAVVPRIKQLLK